MSMKVQIIERDGRPEYAVIPYADYEEMLRLSEAMRDVHAYDAAMADEGEAIPHDMMRRLIDGEAPIKVWREHRGLTQAALAEQAGLDKTYLSQLESGRKTGSVRALKHLAQASPVAIDDLVT